MPGLGHYGRALQQLNAGEAARAEQRCDSEADSALSLEEAAARVNARRALASAGRGASHRDAARRAARAVQA